MFKKNIVHNVNSNKKSIGLQETATEQRDVIIISCIVIPPFTSSGKRFSIANEWNRMRINRSCSDQCT